MVRIRSIRPEFWRSPDIDALTWETRLLYIGLWSYVDDNGVGIDRLALIAADLFAGDLEVNPRETFARVSRGLDELSSGGQIIRYEVEGRPYLSIPSWSKHQRIDRPGADRYPLPTCEDAIIRDTLATPSRDIRDTPATGEGEKGRRGEVKDSRSSPASRTPNATPMNTDRFDEWWSLYPRKQSKGHALKAWRTALKKADAQTILDALRAQLPLIQAQERGFQPLPATWLNGERWADEVSAPTSRPSPWDNARPVERPA